MKNVWQTLGQTLGEWNLGKRPSTAATFVSEQPDWAQANPRQIEKTLQRALAKPSGGWYVVDATRAIGEKPKRYMINEENLVVWRADGKLLVAPEACPHMGASLACGSVQAGKLICPWHGLALDAAGHGKWKPYPSYDDGVLLWARLDTPDDATQAPYLPRRPSTYVDAVIRVLAQCEPCDVIANRLDPWHGVHFHPHSFSKLRVLQRDDDSITVRVTYRIAGPLGIEVDARFHSPEPRTIVMTIIDGEGKGSVVETHATPVKQGLTAVVEATLATSNRLGFALALRAATLFRPWIQRSAKRLWVDDAAYAERQYQLRQSSR